MNFVLELAVIVILCGLVNSLLGTYLVVRENSLVSFGLAHSILVGIVLAYLVTNDLTSPLLLVGAAVSGVAIVSLIEVVNQSRFIRYDAALGLTYLSIFALGIILLTRYAHDTTLTLDSVITGQIIFLPFLRTTFIGINLPTAIWLLGGLLAIDVAFVILFYKELILTSFDATYAKILGFSPKRVNYLLMGLVSLTIVGSYTAVGAILVVAFMIVPAATATLFANEVRTVLGLSLLFSVLGGLAGLWLAILVDVSIAGTISVVYGMSFVVAMFISPRGILQNFRRSRQELQPPPSYMVEHGGI